MWWKGDDKWWSNPKLRRLPRSARGLMADLLSWSSDHRTDGYVQVASLDQIGTALADPDLKALMRGGMVHRRGEGCRCIDKRGFEWPGERGLLIHDFLDYNPSRAENDVKKAQTAELRDPALRAAVRARDFGRCRYCGNYANPKDKRSDDGETLDHVDPSIAAGEANLVIACRGCNSAKKKRTPAQALMMLLDVDEVRARHFAELGISDPDLAPISNRIQVGQAHGPGRVGSGRAGSGRVGTGRDGTGRAATQIGPAATRRDSETPNPYLRAGHGDPALEPPPPQPEVEPTSPRASPIRPRSQRARRSKGRRR